MKWAVMKWRLVLGVVVFGSALVGIYGAVASVSQDEQQWSTVHRGDLVLKVEISGVLQADRSKLLGPPNIRRVWRYKIADMVEEGSAVKSGDTLITFDPSELMRKLEQYQAEAESAAKQIEKEKASLEMRDRDDRLTLQEALARQRRLSVQLDVPSELVIAREHAVLRVDRKMAAREVAYIREKMEADRKAGEAAIEYYQDRYERATGRVRENEEAIERLTVKAPLDGVVVYHADEEGQKKKVGDSCWVGERVIELPDLSRMHGKGEVAEAESGQLREQLSVRLRLDAHPDDEFRGRIRMIHGFVKRRSAEIPLKVVRVDVALDETDPNKMRPGMRFRGWIETARRRGVIKVPADAVFPTADGPVVFRRKLGGHERVRVEIGLRTLGSVEVVSGLEPGDEVSRLNLEKRS